MVALRARVRFEALQQKEWISVGEASHALGCGVGTIYNAIKDGRLTARRDENLPALVYTRDEKFRSFQYKSPGGHQLRPDISVREAIGVEPKKAQG